MTLSDEAETLIAQLIYAVGSGADERDEKADLCAYIAELEHKVAQLQATASPSQKEERR